MSKNHQKGKALENFIVDQLHLHGLDINSYRQHGSGNGLKKGDVDNGLGICFEAKNTAKANLGPTMRQVRREAMGTQEPVIVWHPKQIPMEDSMVVINWAYFIELLKVKKDCAPQGEILDRYEEKNNLEKAVYHLKRVIKNL